MSQKYNEGLPLYRQEKQLERMGIFLSRQTMANWMMDGVNTWLIHLYESLHKKLLQEDIAHADETALQVLNESGRPATSKSFMWMYRTGRASLPIVLYDYQTTRAGKHPKAFLKGFSGYLHVDGYAGYHDLSVSVNWRSDRFIKKTSNFIHFDDCLMSMEFVEGVLYLALTIKRL